MSSTSLVLSAAGNSGGPTTYVEDVFSTWLYTGNGSTQTITNGIDLAGEGGLVWMKNRNSSASFPQHTLIDTVRGGAKWLSSSSTAAEAADPTNMLSSYDSNGFTLLGNSRTNQSSEPYCSWTFRKQPKFFDVVTYTGNGATQNISHNLGSVPGMIIVKRTDTIGDWWVYHRSLPNPVGDATGYITLNSTAAADSDLSAWNQTYPTSSVFSVGNRSGVNANGGTFVAYLFAHNAGGFGATGTDNIISCGSFTTDGTGYGTVNLGYEPQFVLAKRTDAAGPWIIYDVMRGWINGGNDSYLVPNSSGAEGLYESGHPTSTGFTLRDGTASGETYIYMAIRRPMKTPTTGTEVFSTVARSGTGAAATVTAGFAVDLLLAQRRGGISTPSTFADRLRGNTKYMLSSSTAAEFDSTDVVTGFDSNTQVKLGADAGAYANASGQTYVNQMFRRATGFFDVVCYTGTGSARTVTHNLGVAPELMIVKRRDTTGEWCVYSSPTAATNFLYLNATDASAASSTFWNNTAPTSSVFSLGTTSRVNASGGTYVAYLFASVNGVSKVGSYTGNGTNQTINCGFSAGARFVLIKRTDAAGDWCVFDTARGIVSGNDPFLQLNSTAAEVTGEDAVDPVSSGFIVNQTTENLNVNGATYLYLAIA